MPGPTDTPHPPRYPFDAEYLRRLRDGDPDTVAHFDAYFRERLPWVIWDGGIFGADADDVIQETFTRVFDKLRSPKGITSPQSFGAFVFGVCRNTTKELRRDAARLDQLDEACFELPADTPSAEQHLLSGECGQAVRRTLALMKPREREILIAVFVEHRPKDEVCAKYHITRANLRVVLYRAIVRFRFLYPTEG